MNKKVRSEQDGRRMSRMPVMSRVMCAVEHRGYSFDAGIQVRQCCCCARVAQVGRRSERARQAESPRNTLRSTRGPLRSARSARWLWR